LRKSYWERKRDKEWEIGEREKINKKCEEKGEWVRSEKERKLERREERERRRERESWR
jgi:hypothetical protein